MPLLKESKNLLNGLRSICNTNYTIKLIIENASHFCEAFVLLRLGKFNQILAQLQFLNTLKVAYKQF